jgi:predicted permease
MANWREEVRQRLAGLNLSPAREAEIIEELAQHLEDCYRESRIAGSCHEEACQAARAQLAASDVLARELRRLERPAYREPVALGAKRGTVMTDILRDLRYGIRMLRNSPGFTSVALLSLALGIGANVAIFQLIDAVVLRALPVKDPAELVSVRVLSDNGGRTGQFTGRYPFVTNAQWEQIRDRQQSFSEMLAWGTNSFNLATGGEGRYVQGIWVSGNFFEMLGVGPILGRTFTPDDDRRGSAPVAVISYSFWQRQFGGDPAAVGGSLTLDGQPFTIIGVTPPAFFGMEVGRRFDVAAPICSEPITDGEQSVLDRRDGWWLAVAGRLKQGLSLDQASAELSSIAPAVFQASLPAVYGPTEAKRYLGFRLVASPAAAGYSSLRNNYDTALWLLMGIAGLVLLIACANLANLMLARASARDREVVVRLALGASRGRLIRQLLTESLMLATAGAAAGAIIGRTLSQFLVAFLSTGRNRLFVDLNPDWRLLVFIAGLALLTCLLFGLAPAWRCVRTAPAVVIRSSSRGLTASPGRLTLRSALTISQVAMSLVLMVAAILFIRSLRTLVTLDSGFRQDGIVVANVDLSRQSIAKERRLEFKRDLLDRIRSVPGVDSAAYSMVTPATGRMWNENIVVDGSERREGLSDFDLISPGFFKTISVSLLDGRDFDQRDTLTSPKVVIVNQQFAKRFLNGANPIGKTFHIQTASEAGVPEVLQIVGLARNIRDDPHADFNPIVYVPASQDSHPDEGETILIRSDLLLAPLISSVKGVVAEAGSRIGVDFSVLSNMIQDSLLRERLMATLSGFFGGLAALMAMIGLYGVMSYLVAQRKGEVGIRMALGATRLDVVTMIISDAAVLLVIGLAVGTALALVVAGLAKPILFGLKPTDPGTLVAAVSILAAVGVLASLLPARRAAGVDPMDALRCE